MNRFGFSVVLLGCLVLAGMMGPGYAQATAQDATVERTLGTTNAAPGETVTVTTTVTLDSESEVNFADEFAPEFASAELVSVTAGDTELSPLIESAQGDGLVVVLDAVGSGTLEITYEVTLPEDAQAGETYSFDGLVQIDGEEVPIEGDSELTVGAGGAEFAVSIDSVDGPVTAGEAATVEYTVENAGDAEGTQDVAFQVDGSEERTETVTLASGGTESGAFSYETGEADAPEIEVTVMSDDDAATTVVTVSADDDSNTGDSNTGDSDTGDSDDSGPADGDNDDGTDGLAPGFGGLIALLGAALLAGYSLHRIRRQ
jgi:hypothetical protein